MKRCNAWYWEESEKIKRRHEMPGAMEVYKYEGESVAQTSADVISGNDASARAIIDPPLVTVL